uniref:uncharacterized protein K02A2.6-like n=1 Tax=Anopheles coluzzii TaxID=1518534 RepID=UPI0020FFDC31|nr:uncharacterized protein K02A2.6-like [Anopheles coluzzii]
MEYVRTCSSCATAAKSPPHESPQAWGKTNTPWERIHVDYAGPIDGEYFLIVVDAYSKWPEIFKTPSITSTATITMLRGLFARFGMPVTLVTDNGTQFTSEAFSDFCLKNGVHHMRTAPFHPQSNGQAERFVDSFKRALRKIRIGGMALQEAIDIFLQTYRTTPNPQVEQNKSPAELMFGRHIRTCFELLRPPPRLENQATYNSTRLFKQSDLVFIKEYSRNNWKWIPAVIVRKIGHVMYLVQTNDRRTRRCHMNQIRQRFCESTENRSLASIPLSVLLESWNLPLPPQTTINPSETETPVACTSIPQTPSTCMLQPESASQPTKASSSSDRRVVCKQEQLGTSRKSRKVRREQQIQKWAQNAALGYARRYMLHIRIIWADDNTEGAVLQGMSSVNIATNDGPHIEVRQYIKVSSESLCCDVGALFRAVDRQKTN